MGCYELLLDGVTLLNGGVAPRWSNLPLVDCVQRNDEGKDDDHEDGTDNEEVSEDEIEDGLLEEVHLLGGEVQRVSGVGDDGG